MAGEVIVEVGGVVSVDAVAGVSPDISVVGCTPMSANRFTVACCMAVIGRAARVPGPGPVVQAPRPLHGPGAEHQGAARGTVQGQVVGGGLSFAGRGSRSRVKISAVVLVVDDMSISPAGRNPLSASTSHS